MKKFLVLAMVLSLLVACNSGVKVGKNEILIRKGRDIWTFGNGGDKTHSEYIVKDEKTGKIVGRLLVNEKREKVYFLDKDKYIILGKRPMTEEELQEVKRKEEIAKKMEERRKKLLKKYHLKDKKNGF